jgi:hypothetical protein
MNTSYNKSDIYYPKDFWLNKFGSYWYQDVANFGIILLCLIGMILNIISYLVFRGREFYSLTIYEYLRVYSLNSALICAIGSTRFIGYSKHFFAFSNSEWATRYFINFFLPVINSLIMYQSLLDILLSFDRIALFANNRFMFYRRLKPKVTCFILLILSFVLMTNFWLLYTPRQVEVKLNKEQIYIIHFYVKAFTFSSISLIFSNLICNFVPLILEIPVNFITIYQLKVYLDLRKTLMIQYHVNNNRIRQMIPATHQQPLSSIDQRTRKMEIRITLPIIIMSFTSIM